ncbi:MAG: FtsX-like permease family protein [Firmicutes bacterium]|nr:FtsX-like permease family protein [Bacillota bacterium]
MRLGAYLGMAWVNLIGNKLRASLSLLGIAVGIGAMLALIGLGLGFKTAVLKEFEETGTNAVMVFPDLLGESGKRPEPLTEEDRRAIEEVCGAEIRGVVPFVFFGQAKTTRGGKATAPQTIGTNEDFPLIQKLKVRHGRFISAADVAVGRRVAVLDWRTAEKLFGKLTPVGKTIWLSGRPFQVIGALAKTDTDFSLTPGGGGNTVYLPVTTLQRMIDFHDYHGFYIPVVDPARTGEVMKKTEALLARRHGPKHGFQIYSTQQFLTVLLTAMSVLTVLLGAISGIALVVGGIGIMNIMLVTVTERIKEIGLRKAVGATEQDILRQFLLEAVFLCLLGGILGIGLGYLGAYLLGRFTPMKPVITPAVAGMGLGFASTVGLFFGVFPAWKAARLDPIAALHHE